MKEQSSVTRTILMTALWTPAACLGLCAADMPGPVVLKTSSGHELVVPDTMMAAIERKVPGFQVETLASYDDDIQKYYQFTSRQTPWAVLGDFDGDGRQDLIVDGHVGDRFYRLCVWGRVPARVDTLSTKLWGRSGTPFHDVLMYAPPGDQSSNFSDDQVFVFTDAYVDYLFERAGVTWYWQDGRWNPFGSSD
jgi:hypothetical protein